MSTCKGCQFFKDKGSGSPDECRRHPKHIQIMARHWCGEFKPVPVEKSKLHEGYVYPSQLKDNAAIGHERIYVREVEDE